MHLRGFRAAHGPASGLAPPANRASPGDEWSELSHASGTVPREARSRIGSVSACNLSPMPRLSMADDGRCHEVEGTSLVRNADRFHRGVRSACQCVKGSSRAAQITRRTRWLSARPQCIDDHRNAPRKWFSARRQSLSSCVRSRHARGGSGVCRCFSVAVANAARVVTPLRASRRARGGPVPRRCERRGAAPRGLAGPLRSPHTLAKIGAVDAFRERCPGEGHITAARVTPARRRSPRRAKG